MVDDIKNSEMARDYIQDQFWEYWQANAKQVNNGVLPEVEWANIPREDSNGKPLKPLSEGNKPWARVTTRHNGGEQRAFGEPPNRRFRRMGVVIVQVFTPAGKRGLVTGDRLGNVALDAFEGNMSGDVWFKNATQTEVGIDGAWYQVNVSAEFEYDVTK